MGLDPLDWLIRLGLAALLSGVVGFERAATNRAVGVRTTMLIGLGSTAFTLVALDGFGTGEATRMTATIVTGAGFLGAGAIFRQGSGVTGLTTASSLWMVAAVGLAIGSGELVGGTIAAGAALLILEGVGFVETLARKRAARHGVLVEVELNDADGIGSVLKLAERVDHRTELVRYRPLDDGVTIVLRIHPDGFEQLDTAVHVVPEVTATRRVDN